MEEYVDEVIVTNFLTAINGDTSSVTALKANDGGDGISFPEATAAVNNTAEGGRILITFVQIGTIHFDPDVPVQIVQRAKVTIDGDVNGDGFPDVTLEMAGAASLTESTMQAQSEGEDSILVVATSDVTIRGLNIRNFPGSAISVTAFPGTSVSSVVVSKCEVSSLLGTDGITVASLTNEQAAYVSDVLISKNRINGDGTGIVIHTSGTKEVSSPQGISTATNILVTENEITETLDGIKVFLSDIQEATLTGLAITQNTINSAANFGIALQGGFFTSMNRIEATVTDNVVIRSGKECIHVQSGMDSSSPGTDNPYQSTDSRK